MTHKYSLVDLSILPDGSSSSVTSLNNVGQVVGWDGYAGEPFRQAAFIWDNGIVSPLPLPRTGLEAIPRGISDAGVVIGETSLRFGDGAVASDGLSALVTGPGGQSLGGRGRSRFLPFIVTGGHSEFFSHSEEGQVSLRAVNNRGQIIGWVTTLQQEDPNLPARTVRRSYLWDGARQTEITAPDGGRFQAYALNDNGQVVGSAAGGDWDHAWLWREGGAIGLGSLGGYSTPHAINAHGQVVGVSSTAERDEENPVHGFLWENGTLTNLDGAAGERESRPLSINNSGQIVGSFSEDEDSPIHAFLWEEGELFDLNDLLDGGSDWEIIEAVGVNDAGQIACNGEREGVRRGLLLNPW